MFYYYYSPNQILIILEPKYIILRIYSLAYDLKYDYI